MTSNFTGLILIVIGASTTVTAGFGLWGKLMDHNSEKIPSKLEMASLLDWTGITQIGYLLKGWTWKDDSIITGIMLLGIALLIAGFKLS